LWTNEGWLYLAIVIDLHSRKAVGWAIHKHMSVSLVKEALAMAYFRQLPGKGLIHHSDCGSQYTATEYRARLQQYGMIYNSNGLTIGQTFSGMKTERLRIIKALCRRSLNVKK